MNATTAPYAWRHRLPYPIWVVFRFMRVSLTASAFAFFFTGAVILAWTVLPLTALFAKDSRRACQRVVAATFRLFHGYMRVLRLVEPKHIGALPGPGGEGTTGCVLVANHTTLVDVTAILAVMPNVCCVAKTSYTRSKIIGRLLSLAGFIDAGETLEERAACMETALARLSEGFHVLVFPEGTRSPVGQLRRFQRGAFEIACRADVPLIPLLLQCDPSALRKDMRFWHHPDDCAMLSIEVGEPVIPARFGHKSRPMREFVERGFRERLGLNDAGRTG